MWAQAFFYLVHESIGHFRFENCNSKYFNIWNIDRPSKLAKSFSACVRIHNHTYIHNMYSVYVGLWRNMTLPHDVVSSQTTDLTTKCTITEMQEIIIRQRLGENIGQLFLRIYLLNPDFLTFNKMFKVMILESNIFGTRYHFLQVYHGDAWLIVFVDQTETRLWQLQRET